MDTQHHPHRLRGTLVLSLATLIWGSTFVVTKQALNSMPGSALVLARFFIAAIVFTPFLRRGRLLWSASIELGVWLCLGFATQTIGLKYTSVDRSAFLTSLHVIFVPVFAGFLGRGSHRTVWIAALIALLGVGLLSHDGSPPNRGDAWTILCALTFALYITRLETFTASLPTAALTAAHLWVVTALSAGWLLIEHPTPGPIPWRAILYLGLAATALTTCLQTYGQKFVSAPHAAVLYMLEPAWAILFGFWFLSEKLGPRGSAGAALIFLAALLVQLPSRASVGSWISTRSLSRS